MESGLRDQRVHLQVPHGHKGQSATVAYFRLLTSGELQEREKFYRHFLTESVNAISILDFYRDMKDYCHRLLVYAFVKLKIFLTIL